jgi:hypothetical protein
VTDVKWKLTGPYAAHDLVLGIDMHQYEIVAVEKTHKELPQLCRYTVRRFMDNATIHNYPHYLLATHLGRVVRKEDKHGG